MSETEAFERACRELIEKMLSGEIRTKRELQDAKREVCRKYRLSKFPTDADVLEHATPEERRKLREIVVKKPVRSISGVAVVAVMAKPYPCPHGRCAYCPGGPERGVPQSYTGKEPAGRRAKEHDFHPRRQVEARLRQLEISGHPTDKVELIVMGGTFPAMPLCYQEWFVRECLNALTGKDALTIEEAQKHAETAEHRPVGITFETRPDYCKEEHVDRMLRLGATRVEVGVQTIYDFILKRVERGHTVRDTIEATRILKDAGLKVCYHVMPGLPGSDPDRDLRMFKRLFKDPRFKPDMLKIYPCMVFEDTPLYDLWKRGEYEPYDEETAVRVIAEAKRRYIPEYCRIMRVQRDIPAHLAAAGIRKTNLRQLVHEYMEERGWKCRCIRCREAGHRMREGAEVDPERAELRIIRERTWRGGVDYFLAYEDPEADAILGYLRLRKPTEHAHRPEIDPETAIVRELKVVGPTVPLGERDSKAVQHRGFGERLMKKAEELAESELGAERILVISAIGTREYYRRLGYERVGPYMGKELG